MKIVSVNRWYTDISSSTDSKKQYLIKLSFGHADNYLLHELEINVILGFVHFLLLHLLHIEHNLQIGEL